MAVNCASIPESLIESELFGYRGGSFTGARKEGMRGKLLQADGGTLLLDEIGDMPLALQTRLLRVLEERQVVPIGGEPQAVDVRIVSATHRDLLERVEQGSFREDLYYRLNGLEVALPAVRERSDKERLLDFLLHQEAQGQVVRLAPEARQALLGFAWPGNVRQMRNVLRTLVALCEDTIIRFLDLPSIFRTYAPSVGAGMPANEGNGLALHSQVGPLRGHARSHRGGVEPEVSVRGDVLQSAERQALMEVLEAKHWHLTRVAEHLGISRNTLYRKLRKHGISRV